MYHAFCIQFPVIGIHQLSYRHPSVTSFPASKRLFLRHAVVLLFLLTCAVDAMKTVKGEAAAVFIVIVAGRDIGTDVTMLEEGASSWLRAG